MPATFDDVREALVAAVLHFEANNSAVMPPLQFFDFMTLTYTPMACLLFSSGCRYREVTAGTTAIRECNSWITEISCNCKPWQMNLA